MTLFTKYLLKILRNQLLKHMFFQGGVKIHPPSGDKGLTHAKQLSSVTSCDTTAGIGKNGSVTDVQTDVKSEVVI